MRGFKIPWVKLIVQGGLVFNKGIQYTMDENLPLGQYTMGFQISYVTGGYYSKSIIWFYHPSLPLYLSAESINTIRIHVRVSRAGLINSQQELL